MKKVSVGTVKDVGVPPQKSRKKGVIILVVVVAVLIILFMIGNTGCSNKKSADTTPKATPVSITSRVEGLESRVTYIEQHPVVPTTPFDPSGLQALIDTLTARTGTLEITVGAINLSTLQVQVTELAGVVSYLNLSLYGHLLAAPTPTPTTVPGTTPIPTPTPLPTSVYGCGVNRPAAIFPSPSAMNVNISANGSTVNFEWSFCTNAVRYESWFGNDSSDMKLTKTITDPSVTFYRYPVTLNNSFYYWKVVAVSPCNVTEADAWWFKTQ